MKYQIRHHFYNWYHISSASLFNMKIYSEHKNFPQKTDKTYWKTETYMAERTVLLLLYWISPLLSNLIFFVAKNFRFTFFVILYLHAEAVHMNINHPFKNTKKKSVLYNANIHVSTPCLHFHWIKFKEHFSAGIWLDGYLSRDGMDSVSFRENSWKICFYFLYTKDSISFILWFTYNDR